VGGHGGVSEVRGALRGSPRQRQNATDGDPVRNEAKSAVFRLTAEFLPLLDRFIPLFGRVAEFPRFLAGFLKFSVSNPARKQPIPFIFRWSSGIPLIKP
jgi:hypothetical protein